MISLRSYTDQRLAELLRYHDAAVGNIQAELDRRLAVIEQAANRRFDNLDERARVAGEALNARLERMNEFRDAMKDQAARMIDADLFKALEARVDSAERALDRQRGRVSVYATLSGLLLVLVAITTLIVNHVRL